MEVLIQSIAILVIAIAAFMVGLTMGSQSAFRIAQKDLKEISDLTFKLIGLLNEKIASLREKNQCLMQEIECLTKYKKTKK